MTTLDRTRMLRILGNIIGGHGLLQDSPITLPLGRAGLAHLFHQVGFTVGVEVGVWKGAYSETLCAVNPALRLIGVDPWRKMPDYFEQKSDDAVMRRAYGEARERLMPYQCALLRMTSMEAAGLIQDASIDFVYIDGNHRYEAVLQDLEAWAPKVRPGGVIAGHDFINKPKRHIEVERAVRDYTAAHQIHPWFVVPAEKDDLNPSYLWVQR